MHNFIDSSLSTIGTCFELDIDGVTKFAARIKTPNITFLINKIKVFKKRAHVSEFTVLFVVNFFFFVVNCRHFLSVNYSFK